MLPMLQEGLRETFGCDSYSWEKVFKLYTTICSKNENENHWKRI